MARAFIFGGGGAAAVPAGWSKAACIATLLHCTLVPAGLLSYCFLGSPRAPSGSRRCNFHHPEHPPLPPSQVSPLQPANLVLAAFTSPFTLFSLIPRYRGDSQPPLPSVLSAGDWRLIDHDQGFIIPPEFREGRFKLGLK